mmetsp:Transcript_23066/g.48084  ORF Transcript_23066/g.48084 Transcript_23066/m.48084 type:complete len:264 (-) Transcript_23066:117-908(-)|eukprot:CAMPEP_0172440964 /NCGR_PEP_ID=MMETSP1065-20121228/1569_1 /TAXON_ID=265537 /ORGANISM="Amphiprora paludosa, Strain CCMP125" /LENGTH=263 /DNA_ID=CAMNT_0013190091 /DNA_START=44 /DNA_END=835 /DNA_ORIENTATION=+
MNPNPQPDHHHHQEQLETTSPSIQEKQALVLDSSKHGLSPSQVGGDIRDPTKLEMKPKHPLSAYNLFFQLQRKTILEHGINSESNPISAGDVRDTMAENKAKSQSVKKPRVHRKTHGKVGFLELAHEISARWKKVDPATKQLLEDQAAIEKQEYAKKIKIWREQQVAREEASSSTSGATERLTSSAIPTEHWQPPRLLKTEAELRETVTKAMTREKLLKALHVLARDHGVSSLQIIHSLRNMKHTDAWDGIKHLLESPSSRSS